MGKDKKASKWKWSSSLRLLPQGSFEEKTNKQSNLRVLMKQSVHGCTCGISQTAMQNSLICPSSIQHQFNNFNINININQVEVEEIPDNWSLLWKILELMTELSLNKLILYLIWEIIGKRKFIFLYILPPHVV